MIKKEDKNLEEQRQKIVKGLELAYERMIEFKKYKKTPLVVSIDGKVVEIAPEDAPQTTTYHRKKRL